MAKSTYTRGGLNGSVRQSINTGNRADIADLRPEFSDQGLYIDADTQCELMQLIKQLFDQRVNAERDDIIEVPLTEVERSVLDIVCRGRRTNRAALIREALHSMAAQYFHKYKDTKEK